MNSFVIKLRVVFRVSVLYTLVAFGKTCGPSEYKSSKGECCPMCNIGLVVYRDCIGDFSTTCIPCSQGQFMDKPNGLYKCFICKQCSESKGLYIQSQCTTIKDTVCDVLDGYYCIDSNNSQCQLALKHSVCNPGEYTKTPGTKTSNTECVNCPHGFYSPTGVNCTRWTDCAAQKEIEKDAGSSIKDVTCAQQKRGRYGLIVPICAGVVSIIAIIYCLRSQIKQSVCNSMQNPVEIVAECSDLKHPTEETNENYPLSKTHPIPEENKEEEETTTSEDHKQLTNVTLAPYTVTLVNSIFSLCCDLDVVEKL